MRQIVDVAGQMLGDDHPLVAVDQGLAGGGVAGERAIKGGKVLLGRRIAEQPVDHAKKIVTAGALARPTYRQLLAVFQNLLHHQIDIGRLFAQAAEVLRRIVEAVDVIDPQAGDFFLGHQFQDQLVGEGENLGVFDPQRDQVVDGEKPPIVEFFVTDFPVGQAEKLFAEQAVQQIEALGLAGLAIKDPDIFLDELMHLGTAVPQLPQHLLDKGNLVVALLTLLAGRDVFEQVEHAQELDEVWMTALEPGAQPSEIVGEQPVVGFDADRKAEIIVVNGEPLLAVAQLQFAAFQTVAVKLAEKRRQHPAADALVEVVPVDIEKFMVGRVRTVLQHVHQHPVLAVERHVVGHDVLHPADTQFFQMLDQHLKPFRAAQFGIDGVGVHHVVAVLAAAAGGENRRSVNVGHPQLGQIRCDGDGGFKAEVGIQLQPIGRGGNTRHD